MILIPLVLSFFVSSHPVAPVFTAGRKDAVHGLLENYLTKDLGMPVRAELEVIHYEAGWVFLSGKPIRKDGGKVDYKNTHYQSLMAEGGFEEGFFALLKENGTPSRPSFRVVEISVGSFELPYKGWQKKHDAPPAIFPGTVPVASELASFDCSRPRNGVEEAICADRLLAVLDTLGVMQYRASVSLPDETEKAKSEQAAFVRKRDECQDTACIERLTKKRMITLAQRSSKALLSARRPVLWTRKREALKKAGERPKNSEQFRVPLTLFGTLFANSDQITLAHNGREIVRLELSANLPSTGGTRLDVLADGRTERLIQGEVVIERGQITEFDLGRDLMVYNAKLANED